MPSKNNKKRSPVPKKGGAKKQKVEKDPFTLAQEKLHDAFHQFDFVHPELFQPLIENLFVNPKEEREEVAQCFIDQYAKCISQAKTDLLKQRTDLEYEVNNHEEVKVKKEAELVKTSEHITKLDADKIVLDEAVTQAKEATVAAELAFEEEKEKNADQQAKFEEVKKEQTMIKETEEKFFTPGLTEGDNINKKGRQEAEKGFKKILDKSEQWKEESTFVAALPNALFKDIGERTDFEQYVIKYAAEKFSSDVQILETKLAQIKPDTTQQDELEKAFHARTDEQKVAQERVKNNIAGKKTALKEKKELERTLGNFPEELISKQEQLTEMLDKITGFENDVEASFKLLEERTNIIPEEGVVEEVQQTEQVEVAFEDMTGEVPKNMEGDVEMDHDMYQEGEVAATVA